jgi:hypothetical protein
LEKEEEEEDDDNVEVAAGRPPKRMRTTSLSAGADDDDIDGNVANDVSLGDVPLLRLPLEVFTLIAERLLNPRDFLSLSLSCHHMRLFVASLRTCDPMGVLSDTTLARHLQGANVTVSRVVSEWVFAGTPGEWCFAAQSVDAKDGMPRGLGVFRYLKPHGKAMPVTIYGLFVAPNDNSPFVHTSTHYSTTVITANSTLEGRTRTHLRWRTPPRSDTPADPHPERLLGLPRLGGRNQLRDMTEPYLLEHMMILSPTMERHTEQYHAVCATESGLASVSVKYNGSFHPEIITFRRVDSPQVVVATVTLRQLHTSTVDDVGVRYHYSHADIRGPNMAYAGSLHLGISHDRQLLFSLGCLTGSGSMTTSGGLYRSGSFQQGRLDIGVTFVNGSHVSIGRFSAANRTPIPDVWGYHYDLKTHALCSLQYPERLDFCLRAPSNIPANYMQPRIIAHNSADFIAAIVSGYVNPTPTDPACAIMRSYIPPPKADQ